MTAGDLQEVEPGQSDESRGPRRNLQCAECGYGISRPAEPPECPMCRGTTWNPAPWRPFSTTQDWPR